MNGGFIFIKLFFISEYVVIVPNAVAFIRLTVVLIPMGSRSCLLY